MTRKDKYSFVIDVRKYMNKESLKTIFGSSLPPVVCRRDHMLFTLFVFACVWCLFAHSGV